MRRRVARWWAKREKIEESADHRAADRVLLGSSCMGTGIGGMGAGDLVKERWMIMT
jgi:hypothetical protein